MIDILYNWFIDHYPKYNANVDNYRILWYNRKLRRLYIIMIDGNRLILDSDYGRTDHIDLNDPNMFKKLQIIIDNRS